jgi:hypothetical protein
MRKSDVHQGQATEFKRQNQIIAQVFSFLKTQPLSFLFIQKTLLPTAV